jgi:hypothetical protein
MERRDRTNFESLEIPCLSRIRQNNRFWRVTRNRYKLPKIQIFGGKDAIQQRLKSQMAGRLAAGRKDDLAGRREYLAKLKELKNSA